MMKAKDLVESGKVKVVVDAVWNMEEGLSVSLNLSLGDPVIEFKTRAQRRRFATLKLIANSRLGRPMKERKAKEPRGRW